MDENGEILLLHASKNNARPLVLPCALYTLVLTHGAHFTLDCPKKFISLYMELYTKELHALYLVPSYS